MPELPEVEVTRLSFADRIAGARIDSVRMGKPLRWPLGWMPTDWRGERCWPCVGAASTCCWTWTEGLLLLHLGMSGSLSFADAPAAARPRTTISIWRPAAACCA